MKSSRRKSVTGLLVKDLIKALALTALLVWIHASLKNKPSGQYLRQFEFELLQEGLQTATSDDAAYESGGEKLPLIVDISVLHPDKDQRSDRKMLDKIVTELKDAHASAIGIDLDFADDQAQIAADDYQYLAKWQGYSVVRVGVYASAVRRSAQWLGLPEFAEMAAGILLPTKDPEYAILYSRFWHPERPRTSADVTKDPSDCKDPPDDEVCKEDLPELPLAMWLLGHDRQDRKTAFQNVIRRSHKSEAEGWLELGEYPIDYSYLKELRKEIITLKSADDIKVFTSKIRNRSVLVADLHDAKDRFCYIVPHEPLSGALVHACTLASLNRGFFGEVSDALSLTLKLGMTLFVLFGIIGIRLIHTYSKPLHHWDYQYIEILMFTFMSLVTYVVFNFYIRRFGMWPDCLWVCAALFIHPFLTEPFLRTCRAFPKVARAFVTAFAGNGPGAKDES